MSCGNREGISGLPFECRCSVLYSIIIIIYSIVMSFSITHLTLFFRQRLRQCYFAANSKKTKIRESMLPSIENSLQETTKFKAKWHHV